MDYYPIGQVSEMTGIPAVTLRAWERRYGLPKPRRTATGHRLYSSEEVELVRRVQGLMATGYTVSRAVERVRTEREVQAEQPGAGMGSDGWMEYRQRLVEAIDRYDPAALDEAFSAPLSLFPVDLVIDQVFLPVLDQIGSEWTERADGIAREHFFTAYLRNKLGLRFHHEASRARGPLLVTACVPGEMHELGLLLFALAASARGYRVIHLGASLPLRQLPTVVEAAGATAVVLSATCVEFDESMDMELKALVAAVEAPIFVGGEASGPYAATIAAAGAVSLGAKVRAGVEAFDRFMGRPAVRVRPGADDGLVT